MLSTGSVVVGSSLLVSGTGFRPGEPVRITVPGHELATVTANAQGAFGNVTVTLPATFGPGAISISASGLHSQKVADAGVTVLPRSASLSVTPSSFIPGTQVRIEGASFLPGEQVALAVNGTHFAIAVVGVNGGFVLTTVLPSHQITASGLTSRVVAATTVHLTAPLPGAVGSTTWSFAAGRTDSGFSEQIAILNANAGPVHGTITFFYDVNQTKVYPFTLQAHARGTYDAGSILGIGTRFATMVQTDQPIVVARTMLFGAYQQGAHSTAGATQTETTLYFAEGATANGFEEYLTVLNPQAAQAAQVTASFYDRQGTLLASRTIVVEPLHRGNIKVNEVVYTSSIATVLRSDVPIIAERAMYFGAPNGSADGTVVFGEATPALGWAFAGGDMQSGRSEFELLFNPNAASSTIVATYYGEDGRLLQRTFTLAGHARLNIDVTLSVPELARGLHGVVLQSSNGVPFVAEQALYANAMHSGSATVGTPVA